MQMYGMYGKIEGVWVGNILTPVLGGGEKSRNPWDFSQKFPKGKVKLWNLQSSYSQTMIFLGVKLQKNA